jgi:hypothetical protein
VEIILKVQNDKTIFGYIKTNKAGDISKIYTFEEEVQKAKDKGFTGEDVYKEIIRKSCDPKPDDEYLLQLFFDIINFLSSKYIKMINRKNSESNNWYILNVDGNNIEIVIDDLFGITINSQTPEGNSIVRSICDLIEKEFYNR